VGGGGGGGGGGGVWNVLIVGSAKWRAVVSMAMNLQLL